MMDAILPKKVIYTMVSLSLIVLMSFAYVPSAAAIANGAMQGAENGTDRYELGIGGAISVKNPYVSPTGFGNHRDYMIYINDASQYGGTVGAGYYTHDGSTFYDMVYRFKFGGYPNHDLYNSIPLNTNINAQVKEQNDNPTSRCWVAFAYQTPSTTVCFTGSTISGASNIGAIARTFSSYSSGSNDLYGYMYNLQSRYKLTNYPYTIGWENFSDAAYSNYKCSYGGNYVIQYVSGMNAVGFGPRTYTSNSCSTSQPSYEPYGEASQAGQP